MKKVVIRVRTGLNNGLIHDSRRDVTALGGALNICIEKINELVEEVNRLSKNENSK